MKQSWTFPGVARYLCVILKFVWWSDSWVGRMGGKKVIKTLFQSPKHPVEFLNVRKRDLVSGYFNDLMLFSYRISQREPTVKPGRASRGRQCIIWLCSWFLGFGIRLRQLLTRFQPSVTNLSYIYNDVSLSDYFWAFENCGTVYENQCENVNLLTC